jgi:hypothetical protein
MFEVSQITVRNDETILDRRLNPWDFSEAKMLITTKGCHIGTERTLREIEQAYRGYA